MPAGPIDQARASVGKRLGRLEERSRQAVDRATRSSRDAVETISAARDRTDDFLQPLGAWWGTTAGKISKIAQPVVEPAEGVVASIAPLIAAIPLSIARLLLGLLGIVASSIQRMLSASADQVFPALREIAIRAEKQLTPTRVGAGIALLAAALLVGSQFLDLRGVAVGAPLYRGEIASDVPAPITATELTGAAHLWVMIPLALVAAALTLSAALGGRRPLGWIVGGCGAAALIIALAIDLPVGLDPEEAVAYSDASVRLLGGFWAEVGAGIALVISGVMMARGDGPRPSRIVYQVPSETARTTRDGLVI